MARPFFTIGHSTLTIPAFAEALGRAEVGLVADIRTVPRSRTNPQFNADTLPESLAPWQIGYAMLPALGGLRPRSKEVPPETDGLWRNASFHNYADYALGAAFRAGLDELVARGEQVFHIMGDRIEPARLTPGARIEGARVTYPASATA